MAIPSLSDVLLGQYPAGYRGVPLIARASGYTFVLADAGRGALKDVSTAVTYTIPPNSSVAFDIGTILTVVNGNASSNISLAAGAGVTVRLAGSSTTGPRTVTPWGYATAIKIATNVWLVSGPGVA